jgi:hypothetical protein
MGEAVPNLYAEADGAESTHWYHVRCGAYRRPEAFLLAAESATAVVDDRDALVAAAQLGVAHHRLPRVDQVDRAPSGRATCRECRTPIEKGAWRISLLFWQDGRFSPSGFIHVTCAMAHLGTSDILDRLRHFGPMLTDDEAADVGRGLEAGRAASLPPAS